MEREVKKIKREREQKIGLLCFDLKTGEDGNRSSGEFSCELAKKKFVDKKPER